MAEVNHDRRIRRTKKLLLNSLTKLMLQKKINRITVTELTELADVNRSTFYLYYKDIYDMIDKVETEMFVELSSELKKLYTHGARHENVLSFFIYVFEFIRENSNFCKVLLGPEGDSTFLNKFKEAIIASQPPETPSINGIGSRYYMPFFISGCIGTIQQWLEDDMKVPPEEIAVFVISLITEGVNSFDTK